MISWSVRADYRNCGNSKCRRGCVRDGRVTTERPHGPYYVIYAHVGTGERRRQIIRYIGTTPPSDALMRRIEASVVIPTREMIKEWQ